MTTTNYTIETLGNLITEFYGDDVERLAYDYATDLVERSKGSDLDKAEKLEKLINDFQEMCDENALN